MQKNRHSDGTVPCVCTCVHMHVLNKNWNLLPSYKPVWHYLNHGICLEYLIWYKIPKYKAPLESKSKLRANVMLISIGLFHSQQAKSRKLQYLFRQTLFSKSNNISKPFKIYLKFRVRAYRLHNTISSIIKKDLKEK